MKTSRWMPTVTVKRDPDNPLFGLNNDAGRGGRYTPKIPPLQFVDWYLSQLPR